MTVREVMEAADRRKPNLYSREIPLAPAHEVGLRRAPRALAGVPHAAVVEPQDGDTGRRERTGEKDELAVAPHPILGTADHDQDTAWAWLGAGVQDAQEEISAARELHRPLARGALDRGLRW